MSEEKKTKPGGKTPTSTRFMSMEDLLGRSPLLGGGGGLGRPMDELDKAQAREN